MLEHTFIYNPKDIENKSFEIIAELLKGRSINPLHLPILQRVIHTTADLEYINILKISKDAVENGINALQKGCNIVTDTKMAEAGTNKKLLSTLNCKVTCFIRDEEVAKEAQKRGITRSAISMEYASQNPENKIYVVGNAPTALLKLYELAKKGLVKPALVIGVPVGFVNVEESKELFKTSGIPYIMSEGRKGGSNVAAAIVNALLTMAMQNT
jgi:precorrin-8X/cobalt-precorrin-8 methylmutase